MGLQKIKKKQNRRDKEQYLDHHPTRASRGAASCYSSSPVSLPLSFSFPLLLYLSLSIHYKKNYFYRQLLIKVLLTAGKTLNDDHCGHRLVMVYIG